MSIGVLFKYLGSIAYLVVALVIFVGIVYIVFIPYTPIWLDRTMMVAGPIALSLGMALTRKGRN